MADYSFIRNSDGKACGIWIKDPSALNKPGMIEILLFQSAPHLANDYIAKRYREVSNNYDSEGGCFVMFGSAKAPGEISKPIVSSSNVTKKYENKQQYGKESSRQSLSFGVRDEPVRASLTSIKPKSKTTAMLLAIFFGFWAWCYTYDKDATKFWINFGLLVITMGLWIPMAWIWAIIDTAKRPEEFYSKFNQPLPGHPSNSKVQPVPQRNSFVGVNVNSTNKNGRSASKFASSNPNPHIKEALTKADAGGDFHSSIAKAAAKILFDSIVNNAEISAELTIYPPSPGDIIVNLTDTKSLNFDLGNKKNEHPNVVYLDVMVLTNPRTGVSGLYAEGSDGINCMLEDLVKDQTKSYVLRIEQDNMDYLKENSQIWKRVKKVVNP